MSLFEDLLIEWESITGLQAQDWMWKLTLEELMEIVYPDNHGDEGR